VVLVLDQAMVVPSAGVVEDGHAKMSTFAGTGSAVTVMVRLELPVPPVPVQISTKVVLAVRFPVDSLLAIALVPDQPPEASQLVALLLSQNSVVAVPDAICVAPEKRMTTGAGSGVLTMTCADATAVAPFAAVQVMV